MTYSNSQVEPEDAAAIAAYEEAWREFTIELNRLHIAYGAPSYATLVKASDRPRLTKAGLNEVLSGKRFPSLEALLEFVRVVSNPQPPPSDNPATSRARPELVDQWRSRWQHVKFLQRQAHAPWTRVHATAQDMLDQAFREAEDTRATTHEEAALIRAGAEADAERLRSQAQHDADELLQRAQAEAKQLHLRALQDTKELPVPARADADRTPSRWGAALLPPRPAWRPLFAVAAVGAAGMGLAITLAADSLTGQLSSSCRPPAPTLPRRSPSGHSPAQRDHGTGGSRPRTTDDHSRPVLVRLALPHLDTTDLSHALRGSLTHHQQFPNSERLPEAHCFPDSRPGRRMRR